MSTMRQDDHDDKALNHALDSLRSGDVAPQWRKEPAWNSLERQLARRRKKHVRAWIYPVAAAAAILCLMLLRISPPETGAGLVAGYIAVPKPAAPEQQPFPVKKMAASIPEPVSAAPAVAVKIPEQSHRLKERQPAVFANTAAPIPLPVRESPLPDPAPAGMAALPKIRREPEVVYTLNEIMDNLPEREEPPKTYSIIFRGKPISEPPTPNKRRARPGRDVPEADPPHIIN